VRSIDRYSKIEAQDRIKEGVHRVISTKRLVYILSTVLICAITCRQQRPAEYKDFFDLPLPRQVEEFSRYPIDRQLDLYLYDWNHMHPSKVGFAYKIAEKGDSVVPFLIGRLNTEKNENSQDAILHIFEVMFDRRLLTARENVLEVTRNVISKMNNPEIKQLSRERLNKMETAPRS
jgi:hypothetical protein